MMITNDVSTAPIHAYEQHDTTCSCELIVTAYAGTEICGEADPLATLLDLRPAAPPRPHLAPMTGSAIVIQRWHLFARNPSALHRKRHMVDRLADEHGWMIDLVAPPVPSAPLSHAMAA
jgi:hypothetical protein